MSRIVVISEDLAEPWDEGIKKFAYSLGTTLAREHDVALINVDRSDVGGQIATRVSSTKWFSSRELKRALLQHDPETVIYVPSPSGTIASFVRMGALRRSCPNARFGMVAMIPRKHGRVQQAMIRTLAPDVLFVPSNRSRLYFAGFNVATTLLPVGVDVPQFASRGDVAVLRERYGIEPGKYVYLHVGHIRPKRNLLPLAALCADDTEVVVVGSTSTVEDPRVRSELEAAGVKRIREFLPIHELYALADCYVFPVVDSEGCVELPLSVFEALAAGCPVLATPFGGLRDFLQPGKDLIYWETDEELANAAQRLRGRSTATRDMSGYAWERIADQVMGALSGVVA